MFCLIHTFSRLFSYSSSKNGLRTFSDETTTDNSQRLCLCFSKRLGKPSMIFWRVSAAINVFVGSPMWMAPRI